VEAADVRAPLLRISPLHPKKKKKKKKVSSVLTRQACQLGDGGFFDGRREAAA
jgi:hypothetical protein